MPRVTQLYHKFLREMSSTVRTLDSGSAVNQGPPVRHAAPPGLSFLGLLSSLGVRRVSPNAPGPLVPKPFDTSFSLPEHCLSLCWYFLGRLTIMRSTALTPMPPTPPGRFPGPQHNPVLSLRTAAAGGCRGGAILGEEAQRESAPAARGPLRHRPISPAMSTLIEAASFGRETPQGRAVGDTILA